MDNDRPVSIIINKLENHNFSDFAGLIRDAISSASTSGEMISDIAHILTQMKKSNSFAYKILKKDAELFFQEYHDYLF